MQIYERRLLTTFSQTNSDKPPNRNIRYFDAIFGHNQEEEWLQFDTDRDSLYSHPVSLIYLIWKDLSRALSN